MRLSLHSSCGLDELEGLLVEEKEYYKERIITLITQCENLHWLKTIYAYVKKLIG